MNEMPSQHDLDIITSAIQEYPNETISGAVLGTLIRNVAPNLDIRKAVNLPSGTGALSRFVEQFLTHVLFKAGRTALDASGGDILYRIITSGSTSRWNNEYWNVFVSQSKSRVLLLKKTVDGFHLQVKDIKYEPCSEDEHVIESVTLEEFESISKEFIERLASSESGRLLADKLQETKSYSSFMELLKEAGPSYSAEWSEHRRGWVRSLFLGRLSSLGLSLNEKNQLLSILEKSQENARRNIKRDSHISTAIEYNNIARQDSANISPDYFARQIFKAMVDKMSIAEIRAIPVSFGQVLDVFLSFQRRR